jgi:hypothetical protein
VSAVSHEIITPKAGCSMTRPNGSGEGLAALRKSINQSTTAVQLASPPSAGCVDIGRSSSNPGTNASSTGTLQYIPFALDGVAGATGATTNIAGADLFSLGTTAAPGDLINLYACNPVTVNGVTYNPGTASAGQQQIDLYVPQPGSGTRKFWGTVLNFNSTTLPACVHDHSVIDNSVVEEHNGLVLSTDPNGFAPFSIAQWVAQSKSLDDRRHGAVLRSLAPTVGGTAVAPLTAGGSFNISFPITREVYSIVPVSKITSGDPNFDPTLSALLAGSSSQLCRNGLLISKYGFASLGSAPLGHHCGDTTTDLRAFDASNPV